MSEGREWLGRLGKVLKLEAQQGYEDRAVFGGLEGFVDHVAANLEAPLAEALRRHARGYADKDHPERMHAVRELADALRDPKVGVETEIAENKEGEGKKEKATGREATSDASPPPLDAPVRYAKGVGTRRESALNKLGIATIEDLLVYFPRRISDRSVVKRIAQLKAGERATVRGTVRAVDAVKTRGKLELTKVALQDGGAVMYAVWFNQPWLKGQIKPGQPIALYGEATRDYGQVQMNNPIWEPADQTLFTGRLVPVYPATKGINQAALIRLIRDNAARYRDEITEILPADVRERAGLVPRAEAIHHVHFPPSEAEFERARAALAFEELFLFQLGVALHKSATEARPGRALAVDESALDDFTAALPFKLTGAQRHAIAEIRADMAAPHPMNRLLQGDVGAGKTAVAAAACFVAIRAGAQAVMMAPTEILAQQHGVGLTALLEPLGVRCGLLIGSMKEGEKTEVRRLAALGELDLLIGTHALLEDEVAFNDLGLAVIDEQHRFGVIQRAKLEGKGAGVDVLVMSATPIPRTVTLTLYGQFDVSILDQLPFEKRIKTYWIDEGKREEVYGLVADKVRAGVQAYVVYPLVEESETSDLRAATQMKEELAGTHFRDFSVGLLHGRMKEAEKRAVMDALRAKQIQVLVSTTVVEVGIDVPDASVMVIEHAERFGLSQLHQLRGRIGRAGQESVCFAIATPKSDEGRARLRVFQEHLDGFKIAEADLEIRGPGELLGLAQHGLDTTFRAADLIRDLKLMQRARSEAALHLKQNPDTPLIEAFKHRFGDQFEWARF